MLGAVKSSIPKLHKCHLEEKKKSAATKLAFDAYQYFFCEKIDSAVIVNFTLSWEIYSREAKFEFVL